MPGTATTLSAFASQAEFQRRASINGGGGDDTLRFSATSLTASGLTVTATKALASKRLRSLTPLGDSSGTSR